MDYNECSMSLYNVLNEAGIVASGYNRYWIDQFHKSDNAPVPYHTIHHSARNVNNSVVNGVWGYRTGVLHISLLNCVSSDRGQVHLGICCLLGKSMKQAFQIARIPCIEWASYQIRKIAVCACAGNAGNVFPTTNFKGNRWLAIPACITARAMMHVGIGKPPGGENVPGIPGACAIIRIW